MVTPRRWCRCFSSYCICSRSWRSSAPSGSSSSTRRGSKTSARATATRCCWPPESCCVRRSARPSSRTIASARATFCGDLGARQAAHLQRKADILGHAHVGKQRVVLEHHADAALLDRHGGDVLAGHEDAAAARLLEARQHGERGRLARARGAEQGQEFAGLDLEVEGAHGVDLAVVALADVDEPDQRFRTSRAHASTMGRTFRHCRANSVPDPSGHGAPLGSSFRAIWCPKTPSLRRSKVLLDLNRSHSYVV